MSDTDEQIDELLFGLTDGFKEWFKPAVTELISTAVREAREREINDFSNSMASELGEDDSMIVIRSYRNHRLAQLKEGVQE